MSDTDKPRKRPRVTGTSSLATPAGSNSQILRLKIEYVSTSTLTPYPKGLRKHSEKQIAGCVASLRAFGLVAPAIVDQNLTIIDGHALVVAAERLGFTEVPIVRVTHLSPALVKACRIALNKLTEGATWDIEALQFELIELAPALLANDIEFEALGFSTAEFDMMLTQQQATVEEEVVPDAKKYAVTLPGDLWLMDGHRLLAGNALNNEDFTRLLDGAKAHMAFCDAPYNLKVDGVISGLGKVKHREFAMGSGEMTRPDFIAFLTTYMKNCADHSVDGAVHFACMDWRHILELITAGEAAFDKLLNLVVWNKTNAGMGTMYRSQHELIGVFKSGNAPHKNNFGLGDSGRYRTNVWTVAGANAFRKGRDEDLADHPTVKPTALVMDAILDVSSRNDIVLDCFCGSGTTILAAEKTGRHGYGLELDPLYVDVAVRRWQSLTGRSAILSGDGRTFAEITASRSLDEESSNA